MYYFTEVYHIIGNAGYLFSILERNLTFDLQVHRERDKCLKDKSVLELRKYRATLFKCIISQVTLSPGTHGPKIGESIQGPHEFSPTICKGQIWADIYGSAE